jgi:hypothetical protein
MEQAGGFILDAKSLPIIVSVYAAPVLSINAGCVLRGKVAA